MSDSDPGDAPGEPGDTPGEGSAAISAIRNARLTGAGRVDPFGSDPVDVFLAGGVIADIAPAGALAASGRVLDADGAWLHPGLWDHHVHVVQWALESERVRLHGARSAAEAAALMAEGAILPDGCRVGAGFRDGLWPDSPSLELLDAATGDIPTYLVNADVHSVWLNSAALRREGMAADDGMLREGPAFEVSRRLNDVDPARGDAAVARMARDAARRGVVGFVDLDMAWNEAAWTRRLAAGFDTLRVEFGIYPQHLARAVAEGLRTGDRLRGAASDLVHVGPLKVITDGSLGTRTAACTHPYLGHPDDFGLLTVAPSELIALLNTAAGAGLACAVHAIGDAANTHALDAFAQSDAWGTIEHAQLVAHADIPRFARLGVGASVQPEHAVDDRDLADRVWANQTAEAYPLRAFADRGANLLFGSDAPVSPLDPWSAIAAAVFRTRDGRPAWHPEQTVPVAVALAASTHGGSTDAAALVPGAVADLVLLGADPMTASEPALRAMPVVATLIAGRPTHLA